MVGSREINVSEILIKQATGGKVQDGVFRRGMSDPFMPEKMTDEFHPGGNSVCYMIQTAHLMGCDPIYLLGFTLQSGLGYFFGRTNPVTRKTTFYDDVRPAHWLRWYQERYPGRVRLMPGWSGPIYDIFETEPLDESEPAAGPLPQGREPEPEGSDGHYFK